jgi:hypothetical protein
MKWLQWNGFHKKTYAARHPHTWARLQQLDLGINGDTSLIDTVEALLSYVDHLQHRIDQLELEKDFR